MYEKTLFLECFFVKDLWLLNLGVNDCGVWSGCGE